MNAVLPDLHVEERSKQAEVVEKGLNPRRASPRTSDKTTIMKACDIKRCMKDMTPLYQQQPRNGRRIAQRLVYLEKRDRMNGEGR